MYKKIDNKIVNSLNYIFNKNQILLQEPDLVPYSTDESYLSGIIPELVVKPDSHKQIIDLIKIANEYKIPVTARGGGTSVTGASIPYYKGIVVSLENMNNIIDIDTENFCAIVQPGMILENFKNTVEKQNLFYPPDPNSLDSCSIGGTAALSAGGPCCLKYGTTRNYVIGTETVMADSSFSKFGGKFEKITTGYNLNQILIGSEGTLGIITKLILKLIPKPKYQIDLLVPFYKIKNALFTVTKLLKQNFSISVCEFMDQNSIKFSEKFLNRKIQYSDDCESQLLIQLTENSEEQLSFQMEKMGEFLLNNNAADVFVADNELLKNQIWEMRRKLREALKHFSKNKMSEDIVVPRSNISILIESLNKYSKNNGIMIVCYGHIGDGNVHVNIVQNQLSDKDWENKKFDALETVFKTAVKLKGSISGEHGIGLTKKKFLHLCLSEDQISLMKKIKNSIDKNYILNPGKIF